MKKISFILFALVFPINLIHAQQEALDYLDKISGEMNKVVESSMNYSVFSVHTDDERAVDNMRKKVIIQINKSKSVLNNMDSYEGNKKLKNEAVDVLELYHKAYTIDYDAANTLYKDRESSYEAMEQYYEALDQAEKKIGRAADKFKKAQDDYADEYNIILTYNDESSQKMLKINAVNQYSRHIFLVYFKVSKQNAILFDGINEKKIGKVEKSLEEMLVGSKAAHTSLKKTGGYNGDRSYLEAALDVIIFYRDLASDEYKQLLEIMKKEKNKILTQEDVDNYNQIITSYNEDSEKILKRMERKSKIFKQKHIPKN